MKIQFKTFLCLLAITVFCITNLHAQSDGVTLRFSANHTCSYVALDSVLVENLSQDGSTVLHYPDTVVTFVFTDIGTIDDPHQGLYVSQNYPNPFSDHTMIDVFVSEEDHVELAVYDLSGRRLTGYQTHLVPGMHQFSFHACEQQVYVLIVTSQKHAQTRLMLQMAPGRRSVSNLVYEGAVSQAGIKSSGSGFVFNLGDELKFTGYVTDDWGALDYAAINDSPETDQDYLFDIANEVPDQPSEIAGETTVLGNETGLVYEVEQVQGVTYLWTVPDDWTITHGQGSHSITADAGIESGDITVQAENDCGISPERSLAVGVKFLLTLIASPENGGELTGAGQYAAGEEITITAIPNEGWEFTEWTGDTGYVDDPDAESTTVTMPADDVSLTANFEEDDDDETEVVEVINPTTGKTWMDRNLGASRAAISSTDAQAYGDLYQWGRAADGHQKRNSGTTSTLSGSDTPGHGNFILAPNSPWDWHSLQNNNLWQGVNGVNNPCPHGYRLPTEAELDAERQSWGTNNPAGAFGSPLKLPVAGYRHFSLDLLDNVGSGGYYWSSTVDGTRSRFLLFGSTGASMYSYRRASGYSVRCIKD